MTDIIMQARDFLMAQLSENQFAQGGLLIAAMSWAAYQLKSVPTKAWSWVTRYSTASVVFNHGNDVFDAMAKKIASMYTHSKSGWFLHVPSSCEDFSYLVPSGSRWLRRGLCWINTRFEQRELNQSKGRAAVTFSLSMTAYGFGKVAKIKELIANAEREFVQKENSTLWVKVSHGDWWESACKLPPRTFDSVYSRWNNVIKDDLDRFLAAEEDYIKKGIPYRRGYMLSGPPGTGKTTTAQAIANYIKRDLKVLSCNATATSLRSMLSGDRQLILIEDIDAATTAAMDREKSGERMDSIGFSAADLLNAIDGVTSGHGTILLITTNYPDRIDKALMRPGRIDQHIRMSHMDQSEWDMMTLAYFRKKVGEAPRGITAAKAQNAYLCSSGDIDKFLELAQSS